MDAVTDWDDLRYFLAVARKGSIRGTAALLRVNHSTVSRRVAAFERRLGVRLFERLPTGYLMTGAGEEMLASAERIEGEVAAVGRRVVGGDARLSGLLRVTLPDSLATTLLMPDFVAFTEDHPEIELDIVGSYGIADLTRREADVAIRLTSDPPEHLIGRKVVKLAKSIYASPDYLSRHDPTGDPDGLAWIGWDDAVSHPQWVRESDFPKAAIRHRAFKPILQVAAAKAGMGLAMLPCFIADSEPGLQRLPPGKSFFDRDIWLLTHEDLRNTARVRKFMDFMFGAIRRHRDLLEGRCPRG